MFQRCAETTLETSLKGSKLGKKKKVVKVWFYKKLPGGPGKIVVNGVVVHLARGPPYSLKFFKRE